MGTADNVKYKNQNVEEKRDTGTQEVVDFVKGEPSITFTWQGETHPLSGLVPATGSDFWRRLHAGKSNHLLKGFTPPPKPKRLSISSLVLDKSCLLVKKTSDSADSAETYWSLDSPNSDL